MGEKESIIEAKTSYEGIFKTKDVVSLIKDFAKDKGYSFKESAHTESVKKTGRNINLELGISKTVSDYIKAKIVVNLDFTDLNDKTVEKKKYQIGSLSIVIEGLLETDYEKRWESKPTFWMLRYLFEKYVFDSHLKPVKDETSVNVDHLMKQLKAYLNMLT